MVDIIVEVESFKSTSLQINRPKWIDVYKHYPKINAGLLNENDRLIQENQKYKEVIDRLNKLAGIRLLTMYFEDGGEISVLPYEDLLDILEEVE